MRAAEVAAAAGAEVAVFEAMPSVGRKLLVAGRGGLNLTHGEDFERFVTRYSGPGQPPDFWRRALENFPPAKLREWAAGLGIDELGVESKQLAGNFPLVANMSRFAQAFDHALNAVELGGNFSVAR